MFERHSSNHSSCWLTDIQVDKEISVVATEALVLIQVISSIEKSLSPYHHIPNASDV